MIGFVLSSIGSIQIMIAYYYFIDDFTLGFGNRVLLLDPTHHSKWAFRCFISKITIHHYTLYVAALYLLIVQNPL